MQSTSTRKRKHPPKRTSQAQNTPLAKQTYLALYIQAHEADIIRGPHARDAAQSLEIRGQGSALIQWGRPRDSAREQIKGKGMKLIDQDASFDGTGPGNHFDDSKDREIWVDRYVGLMIIMLDMLYEGKLICLFATCISSKLSCSARSSAYSQRFDFY